MGCRGGQGDRQWGVEGTGGQTVGCRGDRGTDSEV